MKQSIFRISVLVNIFLMVSETMKFTSIKELLGVSPIMEAGIIFCVAFTISELADGMTKIQEALKKRGEKSVLVNVLAWLERRIGG